MLTISVLTDNTAGGQFLAEHGLSYLIEIDNEKILFDAGHSNVFLKNAQKLKIEIENEVKTVVLSHGHWDHGNGLKYLSNKTLITHPASFSKRYRKIDHTTVGMDLTKNDIEKLFTLKESKDPLQLTENLFFLGEIPRNNDFESQATSFEFADGSDDFIPDDSALAAIVNNELIVITGCSHSGICNICEHAKKVSGVNKIKAVIGGFHLKKQNKQSLKTVEYFKKNKVAKLLPSHCTALPALALFHSTFKTEQVKTGMVFRF
ncbi:7,8-dihydropterin-6-yl-methyl-4-(beta-D-ribofuranosyl)aminobenzene 5'-phosphate synthase [Draconibacterium orientale]|uniref:7,8-dihydropterin-6-yl-methyl-4-(Beta-D-ribofuranosyl)aminobenzene 5'-phosphate synthase n=1 Tax=Draconibacterium orientale TaxID=1168034 RepID=X5E3I2_9BACT|nr:MBL fold metallo-hydrolase [Draconibacterium orientale]AHW61166.1 beta-lactamase [Draconibacterium orientale]SET35324.1 7,8-dihydropterin-6-yl-methyl-4-(beta-D-ribofuranosyl)aminobenzene 5'-phosphate synthase [Draconibacterium orientale]